MMSRTQAEALATAVHYARPGWDRAGILAAIDAAKDLGSPTTIGRALYALAGNPDIRTPGALRLPGPHWAGTPVAERKPPTMCPDHPDQRLAYCFACAEEREADHAAGVRGVRAALAAATRYTTAYHSRMQQLREQREEEAT